MEKMNASIARNERWTDMAEKVFDLSLQVAVNGDLRGDQMLKREFVFSDMELDQVSFIHRRFRATLVPGAQKGVALVNGFSKNMMR
ncbi:hypothetical protein DKX38_004847 [Salix brachista]|uniref:DUF7788 domain-containing protein n=1 Tax=Salix brachista TaxID=2182728 RepID=A0A5N5NDR9_9ROSI|nr:hypothetical protein DKX38_004847 [Salix brachista]